MTGAVRITDDSLTRVTDDGRRRVTEDFVANTPVWLYGEHKEEPEVVVEPESPPDPRAIIVRRPTLKLPLISEAEIRALARNAYSPTDVRQSVSAILQARREDDEEAILLLT